MNLTGFFSFFISRGAAPFMTGIVLILLDGLILGGIDKAVTAATYRPLSPGEPLAYYHSFQSDQKILVFLLNLFPFLWIYGAILSSFSKAVEGERFSLKSFISGGFKVYWRCLLFGLALMLFVALMGFLWLITQIFTSGLGFLLAAVNILFLIPVIALAVPCHAFATVPGITDRMFLRHIPAYLVWSVVLGAALQLPVAGPYLFLALFLLYLLAVASNRTESQQ
jgi:hypothetical protein